MSTVPVILSVTITPNPVKTGSTFIVSVNANDIEVIPVVESFYSNEFQSGEV